MGGEITFQDVAVEKVMTARPVTIEPEASLSDAAEALLLGNFRHLPVVGPGERPVGMISERDVRAALGTDLYGFTRATLEALAEPVSGVMTPDPVSVRMGTGLGDLLDAFAGVGAVLVVDDDERLRGIVSYVDVLLWLRNHARAPGEEPAPRGRGAGLPRARRGAKPHARKAAPPPAVRKVRSRRRSRPRRGR